MPSSGHAPLVRRRSLLWTLPAVLVAPRRAGRTLIHRGLPTALAVHVLALLGGVAAFAGVLWLFVRGVSDPTSAPVFSVAVAPPRSIGSLPIRDFLFLSVLTAAAGEVFYWAAGVTVLSAWTGAGLTPRGASAHGTVLAGFASVHLVPLAAAWGATIGLGVAMVETARGNPATERLLWSAIVLSAGPLPAVAVAMALRLASGLGEVLPDEPAADDKRCEGCGYNLRATPFESHCPECGLEARRSLSPIHRCFGWEVGRRSYLATLWGIVTRPASVFQGVALRHRLAPARRFLVVSTLASAAIVVLACGAANVCRMGPIGPGLLMTPRLWGPRFLAGLTPGLWLGSWWTVLVPVMAMMTATALHGACRGRQENIHLRGAAKLGCYLSALAVPCAAIAGVLLCAMLQARERGWLPGWTREDYTLVIMIMGAGFLVWYWFVAARAYEASRYANT
ncbi:MAG: hypothetical protein ACOC7R_02515 [Planctomycetota bacterium]